MQFGLSTFFFPNQPLLAVVERIVGHGIETVECTYDLPQIEEMDWRFFTAVRRLQDDGITFSLHGPLFEVNIGSLFREVRAFSRERYRRAIELAAQHRFDPVVVHPGYSLLMERAEGIFKRARNVFDDDLRDLQAYAEGLGVRLALENVHMPYFFFYDLDEFSTIAGTVPGLGMTLDIGHAYLTKLQKGAGDPEGAILDDLSGLRERLFHVHLHNNLGTKDDHLLHRGNIDLERIVKGLKDLSYGGKVILETYETDDGALGRLAETVARFETT
jgi:sugar phosphate isomerase/epimerase